MIKTPNVLISSSEIVFKLKNKIDSKILNLEENQIVKAKVLKLLSTREVQFLINGQKLTAKTYMPLKEGEKLFLKVTKTGLKQVLKPVNFKSKNFSHLNTNIDTNIDRKLLSDIPEKSGPYKSIVDIFKKDKIDTEFIKALDLKDPKIKNIVKDTETVSKNFIKSDVSQQINNLKKIFYKLALKDDSYDTNSLKQWIRDGGSSLERKLVDLFVNNNMETSKLSKLIFEDIKAYALNLSDTKTLENVDDKQKINDFISDLTKLQVVNKQAFEQFGKYLLFLPFLFDETLKFGQMLFNLGNNKDEKDSKKNIIKISLLLEMSNIGDLRADFAVLKNNINGTFGVGNDESAKFLKKHIPELEKNLTKHGFNIININCLVLEPKVLASTSLANEIIENTENRLISLVV